jgi:hypothetical protein
MCYEQGLAGNPSLQGRVAVRYIARQQALLDAQEFGMIGLLSTHAAGDPNATTAAWGRETSLGQIMSAPAVTCGATRSAKRSVLVVSV